MKYTLNMNQNQKMWLLGGTAAALIGAYWYNNKKKIKGEAKKLESSIGKQMESVGKSMEKEGKKIQ